MGVTVDYQLNFNNHVSSLCKKASKQLNVLKRIGMYLNRLGRLTIYHSFILSNFNYCPLVWHFCGEVNTSKIEKIQERALRFVYLDTTSSYEDLLMKANLPSLKIRRMRELAMAAFKIIHKDDKTPSYLHNLITMRNDVYSFRYSNSATLPNVRTTRYGLSSFRFSAAKLWNSLPEHMRNTASVSQFQGMVQQWNGKDTCRCSACR